MRTRESSALTWKNTEQKPMTEYVYLDAKNESVGEHIRRVRKDREISQRELTRRTKNISYGYLSKVESGQREISLRALREVAEALDVNVVYLETGKMEKCPHCLREF